MQSFAYNLGIPLRIPPKLLLIMKLTTFILIIALTQVSAKSLAQKITLNAKNTPIEKVLQSIREQSGYGIIYNAKDVKDETVTVSFKNVSIVEAMNQLVEALPFTYEIVENNVVIKPKDRFIVVKHKGKSLFERVVERFDAIDVRGVVQSEKGEVLEGITVTVKGTDNRTSTNTKGEFLLKGVSEEAILVFTGVSIDAYEMKVSGKKELNVNVSSRQVKLEEVMISTGYQKISKERSAGSYSKVDMTLVANRSTSMNILQRLDGTVPGLVINNSPSATADGNNFLIRGLNTLNSNRNPLVVVDGVAVDISRISTINPQDVADITVLKDATSASIWGARAANGVIVITTKTGKIGKTTITYDGFVNFQGKPDYDYFHVLSSQQYIQAQREIFDAVSNYMPYQKVTVYDPINIKVGLSPDRQILYDMKSGAITAAAGNASLDSLARISNGKQIGDIWYRPAALTNHTISMAGGTDKYAFYNSFAYSGNRDYTPGNSDKTFKINTRQDFNLTSFLKAYFIADLTNRTTSTDHSIAIDNRFLPYQLFRDDAGASIATNYMGYLTEKQRPFIESLGKMPLNYNPMDNRSTGFTKSSIFSGRFNGGITANLFKGLRFEGVYGYIREQNRTYQYDDHTNYQQRVNIMNFAVVAPNGNVTYNLPLAGGQYTTNNAMVENWVVRNQLNYNNSWRDGLHQLTVLFGQEAQEQRTVNNRSTVFGYDLALQSYSLLDYKTLSGAGVSKPLMPNYSANASVLSLLNNYFSEAEMVPRTRFTSYYANVGYTFNRKYTINGSWRNDQSNLFGLSKSAQRKPVWSAGAKWQVSNEPFVRGIDAISTLSIRATYGITGNSPAPGSSATYDVFRPSTAVNAPGGQSLVVSTFSNPYLTWESTKTFNLGIDFGVLHNRISGSVDLYSKKTTNLLGQLPVNPLSGTNAITGNVGSLSNKGIDLSLTSMNIENRSFTWNTTLNLSYNKNKLTSLGLLANPVTRGDQMILQNYMVNYPAFSVFAYNYGGLDALGDPQARLADGKLTKKSIETQLGDILFMGVYQPTWNGSLSNLFSYKAFTMSANIVFNMGNVMFRDMNTLYSGANNIVNQNFQTGNFNSDFANRWKKPGDEAFTDVPAFVADASVSGPRRNLEIYTRGNLNVVNASYAKFRDITLAYQLPATWLRSIKAQSLALRMQLSNVMLWKANHEGIDPEFQNYRTGASSMPFNQKTITLGAHLTF